MNPEEARQTDAAIKPLPYKVKTTNNEYGELRVEGAQP